MTCKGCGGILLLRPKRPDQKYWCPITKKSYFFKEQNETCTNK